MKTTFTHLEKKVLQLLGSNPTLSLSEAAKDSCSEMSRVLALWVKEQHSDRILYIFQGTHVFGGHGAHDILAISDPNTIYLLDPTIWQFFPEAPSMVLGNFTTLEKALDFAQDTYSGVWTIREEIDCSKYTEADLLQVITANIFHSSSL